MFGAHQIITETLGQLPLTTSKNGTLQEVGGNSACGSSNLRSGTLTKRWPREGHKSPNEESRAVGLERVWIQKWEWGTLAPFAVTDD